MNSSKVINDDGQAAPLVAVCLLGLLAITALVIDGGVLFSARRDLQSLADGAARAGAMAIDEPPLRTNGGTVVLDPPAAELAAAEYLKLNEFPGDFNISADTEGVIVRLERSQRTILISLVGIGEIATKARAVASPRTGQEPE